MVRRTVSTVERIRGRDEYQVPFGPWDFGDTEEREAEQNTAENLESLNIYNGAQVRRTREEVHALAQRIFSDKSTTLEQKMISLETLFLETDERLRCVINAVVAERCGKGVVLIDNRTI